jgi:hypothetical protein
VNNFFHEVILSFRQCKKRRNVEIGPVNWQRTRRCLLSGGDGMRRAHSLWIKRWTACRQHPLTNAIACGWVDDLALGRGLSFSICLDAHTRGTDEPTASGTVLAMGLSFHVRLSVNGLRIVPRKSKMAVENSSQGQPDEGTRLSARSGRA